MKTDARKISVEAQKEKRKTAFRMRAMGYSYEEISQVLEVNKSTVGYWISQAKLNGEEKAIKGGKRGASVGQNKRLSLQAEKRIKKKMLKLPEELGLNSSLWTRKAVSQLIEKEYGIKLPIRTIGEYLKRWGYTPQKPTRRAYEQAPEQVEKWLKEEYPAIKKKAEESKGEIHWGDETGVKNSCQHGRSYAPKGKTPVRMVSGKKLKINMISSITNQGKARYMLYEEKMNAELLITFLTQLIKDTDKKVYLILDNLKVHRSKMVREWVDMRSDKIELYFLPPYSPELNPDEYLNCDLKYELSKQQSAKNEVYLELKVLGSMMTIENEPERIKSYFKCKYIQYAA
jgi:transposase